MARWLQLMMPRALSFFSKYAKRPGKLLSGQWLGLATLGLLVLPLVGCVEATQNGISVQVNGGQTGAGNLTLVQIIVLLTVLSLAPAVLMLFTSFIRIVIVLSFVRSALSVPQLPPNQILVGLALFMTLFVMWPVWQQVNLDALQPYLAGEMDNDVAFNRAMAPVRGFMLRQTREKDIELFMAMANTPDADTVEDVPNHVLTPAFIISELKTGFQMGFLVFVPFLIIDLVISSTLMSMGMMMLPPVVISLPFKVLLFVLVDGWNLVARSLLMSFA